MTSSTESDTARASDALRRAVERCERTPRLQEVVLLDSRRPEDCWGGDYFDTLEDEYRYRTIAIVRSIRRGLGSSDHDAFAELSSAFAGAVGIFAAAWWQGRSVAFVMLRRGSKSQDSHFLVVVGALPDLGTPRGGGGDPSGGDEARAAVHLPPWRRDS